jgi:hypothetical protein
MVEPGFDSRGEFTYKYTCTRIYIYTSRKPVRCTGKLLKIKSKLILILFTFFVEYIYIYILVQNVVGKIDKETLRIRFRIDPTFLFKKITKKVFTIG